MIGIGIVTYNALINKSLTEDPDVFKVTCDLLETIDMFTEDEFVVIIRDNDSIDYRYRKFNVTLNSPKFKHLNTVFINSEVNSLTDAWNELLTIGLDDYNCEAMVLLNNDVIATKYWQNFINAIKVQSRDIIGPLSNAAPYQPLQTMVEEAFEPEDTLLVVPAVQGNCLGGSRRAFKENMYDDKNYFDPEIEWAYNEEEWAQRNSAKGGRALLELNSYIIHVGDATWFKRTLWSTKVPKHIYRTPEKPLVLDILEYNDYINGNCSI